MARFKESKRAKNLGQTRRKLLTAAADEFARHGYLGANINRISTSAGFAKGTIYNYFPSKRDLLLELINSVSGRHHQFVRDYVLQETDASRRLARFFEAGFAFVKDYLPQAQAMIIVMYGPDLELKLHLYQAYQPMFKFLSEEVIALGVEQGRFREVDPWATGELLMTLYLGAGSQVDERGEARMSAALVADFAMRALHNSGLKAGV